MGKQILLALVALMAAAVFWPSPAAAQFGIPGIRIMIPVPGMFGSGGYHGRGGYRHSSSARHHRRDRDDDDDNSSPSNELTKNSPSKADTATVDKSVGDKSAPVAVSGNIAQPAVSTASSTAVSGDGAPKATPAMVSDAGQPAEFNPAAYEHAPAPTPER